MSKLINPRVCLALSVMGLISFHPGLSMAAAIPSDIKQAPPLLAQAETTSAVPHNTVVVPGKSSANDTSERAQPIHHKKACSKKHCKHCKSKHCKKHCKKHKSKHSFLKRFKHRDMAYVYDGNSYRVEHKESNPWQQRMHLYGNLKANGGFTDLTNRAGQTTSHVSDIKLNNVNIMGDFLLAKNTYTHIDIHYGDNDIYTDAYQSQAEGGAGVTISGPTAYAVNAPTLQEAYVVLGLPKTEGWYLKAGQMYLDIGYRDDPYTPTPTMSQILSQSNHQAISIGYATDEGFAGTVFGYRGNLDGLNTGHNNFNQFGANFRYSSTFEDTTFVVGAGFLNDARTTYESKGIDSPGLKRYFLDRINDESTFNNRQILYTAYTDMVQGNLSGGLQFTTIDDQLSKTGLKMRPRVMTGYASYRFTALGKAFDVHGLAEGVTRGKNIMAYTWHYNGGFCWFLSKNAEFGLNYDVYRGSDTNLSTFTGTPRSLVVGLASLKFHF